MLDCLIIGGGPTGLTAAVYLARFRRRALLVDAGAPRAAWIPASHNIPFFARGVPGPEILERARAQAANHGAPMRQGTVTALSRTEAGFEAVLDGTEVLRAAAVLLATGAVDIEPALPALPDAVRRGLVRYCPICDGFEARDRRTAVIGHGARGLPEALFLRRTYTDDVTLLTLGEALPAEARARAAGQVALLEAPIEALEVRDDRIAALREGGREHRFEVLYSALGLDYRTGLARALGAHCDARGAVAVDAHCETSVPGLFAAGDIVEGIDQIVVGMAHAAIAATRIHNAI